jgi:hypothetical protein
MGSKTPLDANRSSSSRFLAFAPSVSGRSSIACARAAKSLERFPEGETLDAHQEAEGRRPDAPTAEAVETGSGWG